MAISCSLRATAVGEISKKWIKILENQKGTATFYIETDIHEADGWDTENIEENRWATFSFQRCEAFFDLTESALMKFFQLEDSASLCEPVVHRRVLAIATAESDEIPAESFNDDQSSQPSAQPIASVCRFCALRRNSSVFLELKNDVQNL